MLHVRAAEPGTVGVRAVFESAGTRSRIYTVRDVELYRSLYFHSGIGHQWCGHWRPQFSVSEHSESVGVWRDGAGSRVWVWPVVCSVDGGVAARGNPSHPV